MNHIKKIAFYDHDGTLMDIPMPDTGRIIWKQRTGNDYPHTGWWGQPDSLNQEIFDIKPFPQINQMLNKDNADSSTYTVLLTNRIPRIEPIVMSLLQSFNIKFDEYSFKTDNRNKKERIVDIIKKFPSIEEITVYDDQNDQIEVLRSLKNEIGELIKVEVYQVTEGRLRLVESHQTIEFLIKRDIKKYL